MSLIGAIVIFRQEVRPFTDKQIALVQNFAAQAVIAIENTRLLNELRPRTDDLQRLGAADSNSEVLKVISSSPGALEPVFQAMLENATRICDAQFGVLFRYGGQPFASSSFTWGASGLRRISYVNVADSIQSPGHPMFRVLETKKVHYTADD